MTEHITYYSTNGGIGGLSFMEAMLKGLAPDRGLFMPSHFPPITAGELHEMGHMDYYQVAFTILRKYISSEIDDAHLMKLCREAYDFEVPLEHISEMKYILRLDRGPTASFKDFAARMMSRLMQHYLEVTDRRLVILTATSGDTGSAVANAFHGLENIKVIILFPIEEVSEMQRKQMTTLGGNVSIAAVRGKFDDCQHLVKQAFHDESLKQIPLSSANSINIGRLLPQSVYYFYSAARMADNSFDNLVFSVPSGNFGNLTAGLFALKMGLPVQKFIAATNDNDEFPLFLKTGKYSPVVPSRNCISSAMNVGHPSNLARIVKLYSGLMDERGNIVNQPSMEQMKNEISAFSVSDDDTRLIIEKMWLEGKTLLEPHGAVAWKGISEFEKTSRARNCYVSLETAHPAKFPDEISGILGFVPDTPPSMGELVTKKENFDVIESSYSDLKKLILNKQ